VLHDHLATLLVALGLVPPSWSADAPLPRWDLAVPSLPPLSTMSHHTVCLPSELRDSPHPLHSPTTAGATPGRRQPSFDARRRANAAEPRPLRRRTLGLLEGESNHQTPCSVPPPYFTDAWAAARSAPRRSAGRRRTCCRGTPACSDRSSTRPASRRGFDHVGW
jgi:hypothetical protein